MPQNAPYLKKLGRVYYLKVSRQLVVERLSKGEKHSWLRAGDFEEHVSRMLKEREPAYRKVADCTIIVDGKKTADIVQEIIALHDGEIRVSSIVDRGTTFDVRVPLKFVSKGDTV
jgi:shikimate kinase